MDSTTTRQRPVEKAAERPAEQAVEHRVEHPDEQPLETFGRNLGLRASDDIANPEMARETGTPVSVLRWTPVYVAGLLLAVIAGVGLVVVTVL